MSEIEKRKRDHLEAVLSGQARHSQPAGFDDIRFEHDALPEADLGDIDLSTEFLGRHLRLPYLASSMTGGPQAAERINRAIAEAAQELGFAFGVGSQRISLTTPDSAGLDRRLRDAAPDVLILANLGAVQLVSGMGVDEARRAVEQVGADALILHLNPLQEALQDGGDTCWRGVGQAIARVTRAMSVPVIVKEVGHGISVPVARRLADAGVAVIDVAGAGGTSWAAVEGSRAVEPGGPALGEMFRDWGIPTVRCLIDIHAALPEMPLIASGGIRHGLDAAKAIRLGAQLAGQAGALLPAAMTGTEAVIAHVRLFERALRIACLATGSADLAALRRAPLLGAN